MARTTLVLEMIEAIRLGDVSKEQVLDALGEGFEDSEALRLQSEPLFEVHAYEIVPSWLEAIRVPSLKDVGDVLCRRRSVHEVLAASRGVTYRTVAAAGLHDLSPHGRADVLRVGRHPEQDFQLLDQCVSREHGLIICTGNAVFYCDYGSLKGGHRAGSTNGTFINGEVPIKDTMIFWSPGLDLMLGGRKDEPPAKPYSCKLTINAVNVQRPMAN